MTKPANRLWLAIKAILLRFGMRIGMFFHMFPFPGPPRPSFRRSFAPSHHLRGASRFSWWPWSKGQEQIGLLFYVPKGYEQKRRLGHRYPVVMNFHGGGFCLGTASDDARWFQSIVSEIEAVVVSVDYRMAPEYPFPTAVDDCVDALHHIQAHAAELGLDVSQVVLTGFSSGGNLAFTVPYRLRFGNLTNLSLLDSHSSPDSRRTPGSFFDNPTLLNNQSSPLLRWSTVTPSTSSSNRDFDIRSETTTHVERPSAPSPAYTQPGVTTDSAIDLSIVTTHDTFRGRPGPGSTGSSAGEGASFSTVSPDSLNIIAIFSWYPLLDFVLPRSFRVERSINPNKTLSPFFTSLFDESYVPKISDRYSPFASPCRASETFLREALPRDIFMFICEWDMLLQESREFIPRLGQAGKDVRQITVEKTCHAWDKSVNPFRDQSSIDVYYRQACCEMKKLLYTTSKSPQKSVGITTFSPPSTASSILSQSPFQYR